MGWPKLYARGTQTIGAALAFTPGYAPPEQYQAAGATDQRTDVYGLGATLYYLLTGYQPTEAPARLSAQALRPPAMLNPALSKRTEAVVLRAMELDPAARQQTTLELADALTAARRALTRHGAVSGYPNSPAHEDAAAEPTVAVGSASRAGREIVLMRGSASNAASQSMARMAQLRQLEALRRARFRRQRIAPRRRPRRIESCCHSAQPQARLIAASG